MKVNNNERDNNNAHKKIIVKCYGKEREKNQNLVEYILTTLTENAHCAPSR